MKQPIENASRLPQQPEIRPGAKITDILEDAQRFRESTQGVLQEGTTALQQQEAQEKARLDALRAEFVPVLQKADRANGILKAAQSRLKDIESGTKAKQIQSAINTINEQIPWLQSHFDRLLDGELKDKIGETLGEARQKRAELQQALQAQQRENTEKKTALDRVIKDKLEPDIQAPNDQKYLELQPEVNLLTSAKLAVPKIISAIKTAQDWLKAEKKQDSPRDILKTLKTLLEGVKPKGLITINQQGDFEMGADFVELLPKYQAVKSLNFGTQLQEVIKIANDARKELTKAVRKETDEKFDAFQLQPLKPGQVMKRVLAVIPGGKGGKKERLIGAVILQPGADEGVSAKVANSFLRRQADKETLQAIVKAEIEGKRSPLGRLVDVE